MSKEKGFGSGFSQRLDLDPTSVYLDNIFVWLLVDVHASVLAGQRPGDDDAVRTRLNQYAMITSIIWIDTTKQTNKTNKIGT